MDADKLAKLRAVCDGYERRDEMNVPYGRTRFETVFGPETVKAMLDVVAAAQVAAADIDLMSEDSNGTLEALHNRIAALAEKLR